MTLPNDPPKRTISAAGRISVIAPAVGILWLNGVIIAWYLNINLELAALLWIFACPVFTLIGTVAGGIALYKNRFIWGLILNLPLLLLSALILIYVLSPSDGVPPQYR